MEATGLQSTLSNHQWLRFFLELPAATQATCPRFLLPRPTKSKHNTDLQEKSGHQVITSKTKKGCRRHYKDSSIVAIMSPTRFPYLISDPYGFENNPYFLGRAHNLSISTHIQLRGESNERSRISRCRECVVCPWFVLEFCNNFRRLAQKY